MDNFYNIADEEDEAEIRELLKEVRRLELHLKVVSICFHILDSKTHLIRAETIERTFLALTLRDLTYSLQKAEQAGNEFKSRSLRVQLGVIRGEANDGAGGTVVGRCWRRAVQSHVSQRQHRGKEREHGGGDERCTGGSAATRGRGASLCTNPRFCLTRDRCPSCAQGEYQNHPESFHSIVRDRDIDKVRCKR